MNVKLIVGLGWRQRPNAVTTEVGVERARVR